MPESLPQKPPKSLFLVACSNAACGEVADPQVFGDVALCMLVDPQGGLNACRVGVGCPVCADRARAAPHYGAVTFGKSDASVDSHLDSVAIAAGSAQRDKVFVGGKG